MNEILLAREQRSEHIKQLIDASNGKTIAVLKLNVVGEEKNPIYMKFICMLFREYMNKEFKHKIEKSEKVLSKDGDYFYYVINEIGSVVKERTIYIEDHNYFGRLVDIDVYHEKSISRADLQCEMRTCLVCDNYAHICSRNQTHTQQEIQDKVMEIIKDTLPQMVQYEVISQIYFELDLYPRFGLVGKVDSGSHKDMDFNLFLESTFAIKPYIKQFIDMGFEEIDPIKLKKLGQRAEQTMFEVTKGINTQKGLIFALGIFLPAFIKTIISFEDESYLKQLIKDIAKDIVGDYFETIESKEHKSHGDLIFLEHGIKGIRGEALSGFELLFQDAPNRDGTLYDPYECLIFLMSELDDTTIIHRKGIDTLRKVQKEMKILVDNGGFKKNKLYYETLSDRYKQDGISPGGSSDILVLKLIYENMKFLLKQKD